MCRPSDLKLSDAALSERLTQLIRQDRDTTAEILLHMGEFEDRRLCAPAGCPSMFDYCVRALRMSEDVAYKRIRVARAARRFPQILPAIAAGRLHVTGVYLTTPHLTESNGAELLSAIERMTKREVEKLLAEPFPQPDLPTMVVPAHVAPVAPYFRQLAPAPVAGIMQPQPSDPGRVEATGVLQPQSLRFEPPAPPPRVTPLAPQRHGFQGTMKQAMHDDLQYARALIGPGAGDDMSVLARGLCALIRELEKTKFAATDRPRAGRGASDGSRHIPSAVKREVWERDGGECTYVSETGRPCCERSGLEFDHVRPFGQGGESTADNLRLRCRTHNQLEAERAYGSEFMRDKRRRRLA